ncbi:hypothetical protein [Pseudonocardia asaccharolytica]|nr:hypothetical protein [Pseudonocardia asaccharolytica]
MTSTRPALRTRRVPAHALRARSEVESRAQFRCLVEPTRTPPLPADRRGGRRSLSTMLARAGGALCVLTVVLVYVLVMQQLAIPAG